MRNSRVSIQLHNLVVVLICGAITLFVCSPLSATVTNVTTGEKLFFDDFEGLGTAVSHAEYPDNSGDYDPVASIGTWNIVEAFEETEAPEFVQVTDHVGDGDPGPRWGSNYLRALRQLGAGVTAGMEFPTQSTAGDHIRFEGWLYITDQPGTNGMHLLAKAAPTSAADYLATISVGARAGTVDYYKDGYIRITELNGIPVVNTWQKYTLDYIIGEDTMGFGIDDTYVSDIPMRNIGNSVAMWQLCPEKYGTGGVYPMYFDDIDPASAFKPGDCNMNAKVDENDAAIIAENWLMQGGASWSMGDFNDDGNVDEIDATLMATNWQGSGASAGVPEPGAILMLAPIAMVLAIALSSRRRRK